MFGIGSTELLVILIVALVVLGPKSLPGIAKTVGKVMGEFRRVSTEFQRTMNAEVANEEHEKRKKEAEEELFGKEAPTTVASPAQGPTTDVNAHASTAKEVPLADVAPAAQPSEPSDVAASPINSTAADTPVAAAVAKAQAEAASTVVLDPSVKEKA